MCVSARVIVRRRAATPATSTVACVLIVGPVERGMAVSTVSTRANRNRIALDHSIMGKPSWIHSIIGREASADVESYQRCFLFGCGLRCLDSWGLIFSIVDPHDTTVPSVASRNIVSWFRPMSPLAETWIPHMSAT